ncbi:3-ketoacyl-ACP reductase [Palleronia sp. LCG004]|uniref:3-ketoacyl-ACP reductase n=1 Tax=Palleronia sp. LCG004 TaxID=3079304 RepID=UPI0029425C30|nr:3-ketoacyl-ACP reductase [Palleronia sp. LCG004]WOI56681.1 3-ketoacyl-ACP reductase [Palleronia sp. LCG004]
MENEDLHDRLELLRRKIEAAEERLHERDNPPHDEAHLTARELKERYRRLQARVSDEVADAEAHGHHVSNLERSVRQWVDSFDTAHTASD